METPERRVIRLERELEDARATAERDAHPAVRDASQHPGIGGELAAVPRRVPGKFVLAELLPWNWWYVWALFMVAVVGGALLGRSTPGALAVVGACALAGVALLHVRAARRRLALLRWGKVAKVVGTEGVSRGSYYSGTTYSNMLIPVAHGWKVERDFYSGPKVVTRIRYQLDGRDGELIFGGQAYADGIILAHAKQPGVALCVSSFLYDLDRDADGNWIGKLRPGLIVRMTAAAVLLVLWLGAVGFAAALSSPWSPSGVPRPSVAHPVPRAPADGRRPVAPRRSSP